MRLIRQSDWQHMPWKNGGGTTAEIARFPAGGDLGDFDWRISAATVAADGLFSLFEGCDRTLLVLDGQGITLRGDAFDSVALSRTSPPFAFAADQAVGSHLVDGPILDLNIMTRRGRFAHRVERMVLDGPISVVAASAFTAIFCEDSGLVITSEGEEHLLGARDTALVNSGFVANSERPASIILVHVEQMR